MTSIREIEHALKLLEIMKVHWPIVRDLINPTAVPVEGIQSVQAINDAMEG